MKLPGVVDDDRLRVKRIAEVGFFEGTVRAQLVLRDDQVFLVELDAELAVVLGSALQRAGWGAQECKKGSQ